MRGRTNIPPRKQPVINGIVQSFTVASGNTIEKGDFVKYHLSDVTRAFDERNITDVNVYNYDVANNKYIVVGYDGTNYVFVIYLVQTSSSGVSVLDSVVTTDVGTSTKEGYPPFIEGGNVYFLSSVSSGDVESSDAICVLKHYLVTNDEFVEQNDISFSISKTYLTGLSSARYVYPIGAVVKNNVLFVFINSTGYLSGNGTRYPLYVLQYSISQGVVAYQNSIRLTSWLQALLTVSPTRCFCYGDRIVIGCRVDAFAFSFDSTTGLYVFDGTYCGASSNTQNIQKVVCDGRYLFVYGNSISSKVYDLNQSGFVALHTISQSGTFYALGYVDVGKFIARIGNDYVVYVVGATLTSFSKTLNLIPISFIPYDGETSYYLKSGVVYGRIVIDFDNEGIEIGIFDGSVEEYDGSGAIGFAKTGGIGGSTIQVYTPSV